MSRNLKVACGSLGISIVVPDMKAGAYWATESVARYSEALETIINVVAAIGAAVGASLKDHQAKAARISHH